MCLFHKVRLTHPGGAFQSSAGVMLIPPESDNDLVSQTTKDSRFTLARILVLGIAATVCAFMVARDHLSQTRAEAVRKMIENKRVSISDICHCDPSFFESHTLDSGVRTIRLTADYNRDGTPERTDSTRSTDGGKTWSPWSTLRR